MTEKDTIQNWLWASLHLHIGSEQSEHEDWYIGRRSFAFNLTIHSVATHFVIHSTIDTKYRKLCFGKAKSSETPNERKTLKMVPPCITADYKLRCIVVFTILFHIVKHYQKAPTATAFRKHTLSIHHVLLCTTGDVLQSGASCRGQKVTIKTSQKKKKPFTARNLISKHKEWGKDERFCRKMAIIYHEYATVLQFIFSHPFWSGSKPL